MAVIAQIPMLESTFRIFFSSEEKWINAVVNVGVSYTLGHFIFFIGSFLDTWIYENVKKVYWTNQDLTAYAIALKNEKTGIDKRETLGAFKWACAWLLA